MPPGGGGDGGGGGGLPGTPAQNNRCMMVYTPPVIGGVIDNYLQPWAGGSLDPNDHVVTIYVTCMMLLPS